MDLGLLPRDGVSLRHLRLHGGGEALRARLQLERMLNEIDWSPPGLGPRALLLVRRMAVDARRGFAPRAEGGGFARQVSATLCERAASARRPWSQRGAATADAVCFADEAELLACLWRDWACGAVPAHWWWASVLRRQPAATWLREQLFARGDRLVPAMALLATQGDLGGCIQKIDEADAALALRAVQASHALRALDAAATRSSSPQAQRAAMPTPPRSRPSVTQTVASRWRQPLALGQLVGAVPELRSFSAAPAARRLLAVALAVQRVPRWARSPALPQALAELDAGQMVDLEAASTERPRGGQPGRQGAPAVHPSATPLGRSPPSAFPGLQAPAPVPAARASAPQWSSDDAAVPPNAASHAASSPVGDAPPELHLPLPSPPVCAGPAMAAQPARPQTVAEPAHAGPAPVPVLHSRYGGLFYLLNIALAWRIYGDFTMPRQPGISLSPWDLLAWTGRAWFGRDFEADPLWPLLAELAGRELPALPGDDFDDAPDWTPPADAPVACAEAAAEPHRGRRWLRHWRVAVETRLRSALGCDDGVDLLCRHRAGIAAGVAAVDVTLSLAALPLPIRYAGLDRDPGWIPAAGRNVMFHFD